MKVSLITVTYNSEKTISETIKSIQAQDYEKIEYIIVDGSSTDHTIQQIESFNHVVTKLISEPDHGIYDAMNKGISMSTGDIIGILNSDDVYANSSIISTIIKTFKSCKTDSVFGDLIFFKDNDFNKVTRYYSSAQFDPSLFAYGWMPAHPTFFVRRSIYEKFGTFQTDYKIAADYELLTRFLAKHKVSYTYIPQILVKMRTGGASTKSLMSNYILNKEIIRACRENDIQTNWFKVLSKYPTKIFQLINRPKAAMPKGKASL